MGHFKHLVTKGMLFLLGQSIPKNITSIHRTIDIPSCFKLYNLEINFLLQSCPSILS